MASYLFSISVTRRHTNRVDMLLIKDNRNITQILLLCLDVEPYAWNVRYTRFVRWISYRLSVPPFWYRWWFAPWKLLKIKPIIYDYNQWRTQDFVSGFNKNKVMGPRGALPLLPPKHHIQITYTNTNCITRYCQDFHKSLVILWK